MTGPGRVVEVRNTTRDSIIGTRIRVAQSFIARGKGLMFDQALDEDAGLLIDPCGSIHMFFMRFPIDVLYVDSFDRVVRTQRGIKPWRLGPLYTRGAKYVIELPIGTIDRSCTAVGDQLRIEPRNAS
jgi:uncharacterized membrane protein (UPF0127 family)